MLLSMRLSMWTVGGESVEAKEKELQNLIDSKSDFALLKTINVTVDMLDLTPITETYFMQMRTAPNIPNIPENCKFVIIYCDIKLTVGDSAPYYFQTVWASPVVNSRIIFPQTEFPTTRIITIDAQPTITVTQGSCWCYG